MPLIFHLLNEAEYKAFRLKLMLDIEQNGKVSHRPYLDSRNIPTIGLGMKLSDAVAGKAAIDKILNADPNIQLSPDGQLDETSYSDQINAIVRTPYSSKSEYNKLQNKLDAIMKARADNPLIIYPEKRATFTFINDKEIHDVFDTVSMNYEQRVDHKIQSIPFSKERAVLFALAYNNQGLIGPKLVEAITDGNRAEAWYQIRYCSNGGASKSNGIAKIRYYESQQFNLFDDTEVTALAANQIERMVAHHKEHIDNYDKTYGAQINAANRDYQTSCVQSLSEALKSVALTSVSGEKSADAIQSPFNATVIQAIINTIMQRLSEHDSNEGLQKSSHPITKEAIAKNSKFSSWSNKLYFFRTSEAAYYASAEVPALIFEKTGLNVTVVDETPFGQFHIKAIYSKDLNDIVLAIRGTVPSNIDNINDDLKLLLGSLAAAFFGGEVFSSIDDPKHLGVVKFAAAYYLQFINEKLPELRRNGTVSTDCTLTFSAHSLGTQASAYLSKEYGGKCFNLESTGVSPVHFKKMVASENFKHENFETYQSTKNMINNLNHKGNAGNVYRKVPQLQGTYLEKFIEIIDYNPILRVAHELAMLNDEHSAGNTLNRTDAGDSVAQEQSCPVHTLPGYPFGVQPTVAQNINHSIIESAAERANHNTTNHAMNVPAHEAMPSPSGSASAPSTAVPIKTENTPEFTRSLTFDAQFISTNDGHMGVAGHVNVPLNQKATLDLQGRVTRSPAGTPGAALGVNLTHQCHSTRSTILHAGLGVFATPQEKGASLGGGVNFTPKSSTIIDVGVNGGILITSAGVAAVGVTGTVGLVDGAITVGYTTTQGLFISVAAFTPAGWICLATGLVIIGGGILTKVLLDKKHANLMPFSVDGKPCSDLHKMTQTMTLGDLGKKDLNKLSKKMSNWRKSPCEADQQALDAIEYYKTHPTHASNTAWSKGDFEQLSALYVHAYNKAHQAIVLEHNNGNIEDAQHQAKQLAKDFPHIPSAKTLAHVLQQHTQACQNIINQQAALGHALQLLNHHNGDVAIAFINTQFDDTKDVIHYKFALATAIIQKGHLSNDAMVFCHEQIERYLSINTLDNQQKSIACFYAAWLSNQNQDNHDTRQKLLETAKKINNEGSIDPTVAQVLSDVLCRELTFNDARMALQKASLPTTSVDLAQTKAIQVGLHAVLFIVKKGLELVKHSGQLTYDELLYLAKIEEIFIVVGGGVELGLQGLSGWLSDKIHASEIERLSATLSPEKIAEMNNTLAIDQNLRNIQLIISALSLVNSLVLMFIPEDSPWRETGNNIAIGLDLLGTGACAAGGLVSFCKAMESYKETANQLKALTDVPITSDAVLFTASDNVILSGFSVGVAAFFIALPLCAYAERNYFAPQHKLGRAPTDSLWVAVELTVTGTILIGVPVSAAFYVYSNCNVIVDIMTQYGNIESAKAVNYLVLGSADFIKTSAVYMTKAFLALSPPVQIAVVVAGVVTAGVGSAYAVSYGQFQNGISNITTNLRLARENPDGCGVMKLLVDPETMTADELKLALNNKPSYVLYNSKVYFIDKNFNKKELYTGLWWSRESIDQLAALFPSEANKHGDASNENLNKIAALTGHHPEAAWAYLDTAQNNLNELFNVKQYWVAGDPAWTNHETLLGLQDQITVSKVLNKLKNALNTDNSSEKKDEPAKPASPANSLPLADMISEINAALALCDKQIKNKPGDPGMRLIRYEASITAIHLLQLSSNKIGTSPGDIAKNNAEIKRHLDHAREDTDCMIKESDWSQWNLEWAVDKKHGSSKSWSNYFWVEGLIGKESIGTMEAWLCKLQLEQIEGRYLDALNALQQLNALQLFKPEWSTKNTNEIHKKMQELSASIVGGYKQSLDAIPRHLSGDTGTLFLYDKDDVPSMQRVWRNGEVFYWDDKRTSNEAGMPAAQEKVWIKHEKQEKQLGDIEESFVDVDGTKVKKYHISTHIEHEINALQSATQAIQTHLSQPSVDRWADGVISQFPALNYYPQKRQLMDAVQNQVNDMIANSIKYAGHIEQNELSIKKMIGDFRSSWENYVKEHPEKIESLIKEWQLDHRLFKSKCDAIIEDVSVEALKNKINAHMETVATTIAGTLLTDKFTGVEKGVNAASIKLTAYKERMNGAVSRMDSELDVKVKHNLQVLSTKTNIEVGTTGVQLALRVINDHYTQKNQRDNEVKPLPSWGYDARINQRPGQQHALKPSASASSCKPEAKKGHAFFTNKHPEESKKSTPCHAFFTQKTMPTTGMDHNKKYPAVAAAKKSLF